MPLYTYRCVDCQTQDQRVAGPDDATAVCVCGGLMLRLDPEIFEPIDRPRLRLCPCCGPKLTVEGEGNGADRGLLGGVLGRG